MAQHLCLGGLFGILPAEKEEAFLLHLSRTELPACVETLCLKGLRHATELPAFRHHSALLELRLFACVSLQVLPHSLLHLRRLEVRQCNQLTGLPAAMPCTLEELVVEACPSLITLRPGIECLRSLTKLSLAHCTAVQLPLSISKVDTLQHLNVTGCNISPFVLDSICQLTAVTELNLGTCKIAALPAALGNLRSLELLNLSHCCHLTALPLSLSQCTALRRLDCFLCGVSALPEGMWRCTALQDLDLRARCRILDLPDWLMNVPRLRLNRL